MVAAVTRTLARCSRRGAVRPEGCPSRWAGADAPTVRALRELAGVGPFGARGRLALAWLFATRWLGRGSVRLSFASHGAVYVDRSTSASDIAALREIFVPRKNPYGTTYDDAVVVDIGGHKGYFGVFVLLAGARSVVSYEPASANYAALARTAAAFTRAGARWQVRKAAVGVEPGETALALSAESWAHSLAAPLPERGPARRVATEMVEVVSGADVIREAARAAAGTRLIVKVDAEGSECELCPRLGAEVWGLVDELFVETHEAAPCGLADLLAPLASAGLVLRGERGSVAHLARERRGRE